VAERPFYVDLAWTARDYAKRVWDNSGEDDVLFLAGGVAFNIMLTAVPFVLLAVWAAGYFFQAFNPDLNSTDAVVHALDLVLPTHDPTANSRLHQFLGDVFKANKSIGIYGAIGFVWFSTRLFGSLRTVLRSIFDIENERGIIAGKIFDVKITVVASLLFVVSMSLSAYIAVATSRGVVLLEEHGIRADVMGALEYWILRGVSFVILLFMFFALYKFLPIRRVRTSTAWIASLFTGIMFEAARAVFAYYARTFNPASAYSGAITTIIVIVVWFYYAALIFILGGEIGQVYELRRTRRKQREAWS
jgi:membrane protein